MTERCPRRSNDVVCLYSQELLTAYTDFGRMFMEQALMIAPSLIKSCIQVGVRQCWWTCEYAGFVALHDED